MTNCWQNGRDAWLAAVILLSLLFPAYYMVTSWVISWRRRRCP